MDDQTANIFIDCFRSPDRFGKGLGDFNQLCGPDRFDRLGDTTEHLVETAADLRTEAQCQRSPRGVGKLADCLETENAQIRDDL
ncbi:hypothetical protein D3C87_1508460 [compost metagenome]